jgi:hypothetical protein
MSDNITRRNLVAVVGAGLTLSACGGRLWHGDEDDERGPWGTKGHSTDWGRSPTTNPETIPDPNPYKGKFNPKFLALVHIEPTDDWTMSVNYSSFKWEGANDDAARLTRAVQIFSRKTETVKRPRFREMQQNYSNDFKDMYEFRQQGVYDFDHLNNFKFANQTDIFFFFDSPNIMFEGHPLMTATEKTSTGGACALNHSFLGASVVNDALIGNLKGKGRIVRVRNYVMDSKGAKIELPEQLFSLNIHFTVQDLKQDNPVPMAFDPDTGNGSGYEP